MQNKHSPLSSQRKNQKISQDAIARSKAKISKPKFITSPAQLSKFDGIL